MSSTISNQTYINSNASLYAEIYKKKKRKFINNLITDDNQFEVKASVTLNMDGVPHFNG